MNEIWKPAPNCSGLIEVSSFGRVRRLPRPLVYKDGRRGMLKGGLLRGSQTKEGYINVRFDGGDFGLHRLIAEAFHGKPKDAFAFQTVNHINGIKTDNRPENLEWATYKRNNDHARDAGLCKQHGENTNLSKHSDQFISAMRNVHETYKPNYAELGRMFGMSGSHARQIVLHKTRKRATG